MNIERLTILAKFLETVQDNKLEKMGIQHGS